MKALRWTCKKDTAQYMNMRKRQNERASANNPYENEVWKRLQKRSHKWTRQARWGYRIFDFWCHTLGIAIEVDGATHDPVYDAYRDEYNFRRSGIVVLRMHNGDTNALERIMAALPKFGTRQERKEELGIVGDKKEKQKLAVLPYPPSLLAKYLREKDE